MRIVAILSVWRKCTFWPVKPLLAHDTICTMRIGDDTEQYHGALARCEETAGNLGHTLDGVWYPVDERLHASICVLCGAMVWLTRRGQENRWRIGGTALKEECLSVGGNYYYFGVS
jgi:hypothetical protein